MPPAEPQIPDRVCSAEGLSCEHYLYMALALRVNTVQKWTVDLWLLS
jgi:hypothetical protein